MIFFFLILTNKIKNIDNFNEIKPVSKLELFDFATTSLDNTKQGNCHCTV